MNRGAWLATVHGGTESDRTEQLTHTNTHTHTHFTYNYDYVRASQVVLVVKNLPAKARDKRNVGWIPGFGKIPWRRSWQPTPVFLPGESPWTKEPGRLQPMGSQRAGHD